MIGQWWEVSSTETVMATETATIVHCAPRIRACQLATATHRPRWLLLGEGPDDADRKALVQAVRLVSPDVLLAVLATDGDLAMSDRWMRRRCAAYLSLDSSLDRVVRILRFVQETGVVVVDKRFQDVSHSQQAAPIADLTRREREVLHWMRLGRHNHEIAKALYVSASTIDFHVRNVLKKLGARNRIEAINRASALGL